MLSYPAADATPSEAWTLCLLLVDVTVVCDGRRPTLTKYSVRRQPSQTARSRRPMQHEGDRAPARAPGTDSEQEEEREDSISTRFMVGDLSAYCKGQYADLVYNT